MKLKDILRLIPGSQLVTIINDERVILEGWELFNAYSKLEKKEEYLEYSVVRIETLQGNLRIKIVKD